MVLSLCKIADDETNTLYIICIHMILVFKIREYLCKNVFKSQQTAVILLSCLSRPHEFLMTSISPAKNDESYQGMLLLSEIHFQLDQAFLGPRTR